MPGLHPDNAIYDVLPLSEDTLRAEYLFGLNLTDEFGNSFPSQLFQNAIRVAWTRLERELDVCIVPTKFTRELHDYETERYIKFVWIQPDNVPILSVERVAMEYPLGFQVLEFPKEWISVDPLKRIQIIPKTGTLSQVLIGSGQVLLPVLAGSVGHVPDLLVVDYTAGFKADSIPYDVRHAAALYAAINVLNPAGDLVVGAGIARKTIEIPGLKQIIDTTASPTNAAFGARILQYRQELKSLVPELRRFYHGVRMEVA